jgi:hypothetical protein
MSQQIPCANKHHNAASAATAAAAAVVSGHAKLGICAKTWQR